MSTFLLYFSGTKNSRPLMPVQMQAQRRPHQAESGVAEHAISHHLSSQSSSVGHTRHPAHPQTRGLPRRRRWLQPQTARSLLWQSFPPGEIPRCCGRRILHRQSVDRFVTVRGASLLVIVSSHIGSGPADGGVAGRGDPGRLFQAIWWRQEAQPGPRSTRCC